MDFDVIPFEDVQFGERLGKGSFGEVYRGTYLGLDIAIKEVKQSDEYDVHKYFEREWRIMRECRHPNVVLFLGLCHEPREVMGSHGRWVRGGRVFIVSEFIPGGNLRTYLWNNRHNPAKFSWRLRVSFGIDIARALAYLNARKARKCIHRDLKGENLLITANDRIKITDFGFARIAPRNDDEAKRISYCGTDGYMSPEILNGQPFDERTDIFSFGVIMAELICGELVQKDKFLTRYPLSYELDRQEVEDLLDPGCPPDLLELVMHCCKEKPEDRPSMVEILSRLQKLEVLLARTAPGLYGEHIGSIKIIKHRQNKVNDLRSWFNNTNQFERPEPENSSIAAMRAPSMVDVDMDSEAEEEEVLRLMAAGPNAGDTAGHGQEEATTWRTAQWESPKGSVFGMFATEDGAKVTSADKAQTPANDRLQAQPPPTEGASSIMTVKASPKREQEPSGLPSVNMEPHTTASDLRASPTGKYHAQEATISSIRHMPGGYHKSQGPAVPDLLDSVSKMSIDQPAQTAVEPEQQQGGEGAGDYFLIDDSSTEIPTHRFSLVTKSLLQGAGAGAGKKSSAFKTAAFNLGSLFIPAHNVHPNSNKLQKEHGHPHPHTHPSPLMTPQTSDESTSGGDITAGGIVVKPSTKCEVCKKKLGATKLMRCDDCGVMVHAKCSSKTAPDCSARRKLSFGRSAANKVKGAAMYGLAGVSVHGDRVGYEVVEEEAEEGEEVGGEGEEDDLAGAGAGTGNQNPQQLQNPQALGDLPAHRQRQPKPKDKQDAKTQKPRTQQYYSPPRSYTPPEPLSAEELQKREEAKTFKNGAGKRKNTYW